MKFPEDLRFSKEHEWVSVADDVATIGISDFAQDELGDIVFVEAPEIGAVLSQGDAFGVAESVKTVSDLFCPVTGEVVEINADLEDTPELVNKSPYQDGWMIKIKISDPSELDGLMSAKEYESYVLESK
ncbi:Glycine cleavage system H protein [hydrothermal vent metagenome]|uniref:Glycine cleavage system H protein n=1 Tax=hydrothermal vent metagenome TaxID=652676 RepID=A0A3B1BY03_9ZZZZ